MGHEFHDFRGRTLSMNNGDIEEVMAWLGYASRLADRGTDIPEGVWGLIEDWDHELVHGIGSVCPQPRFDDFLKADGDVAAFLTLLEEAEGIVRSFGEVRPGECVNALNVSGEYQDRPVGDVVRAM